MAINSSGNGATNGNGAATGELTNIEATMAAPTSDAAAANPQMDPEILKKIAAVCSHVRESFGKTVMAMMMLPRYRNQSIGDLQNLVLEPLIRDRIALAYPGNKDEKDFDDISGVAHA